MSRAFRLLPLVGVAMGGLIATKALSGAVALPDLLSASSASAEEASPKKGARPRKLNEAAAQTPLQSTAPAPAPKPPPVCAPSLAELAKEASLSPSELNTLQSLQARRGQLDQREHDIDTQRQLLAAAELKLDAKLRALTALRDEMKGVLAQADASKQAEVDRLVKVYEKMKPRDAGAVMATLEERVRLPVASKMREASLAAILSQMGTLEAKKLTESLARRFAPPEKLVQAAASSASPPSAVADPLAGPAESPVSPAKAVQKPRSTGKSAPKLAAKHSAAKLAAKQSGAPKLAETGPTPAKADVPDSSGPKVAAAPPVASPGQVAAAGDTRAR